MKSVLTLQTPEQLRIFLNPQRQRLLRALELSQTPRTPKSLSDELGVSASSVQHHLKKLEAIGLVRMDHTELLRGITARYYAATRVTVHIGGERDDALSGEREALLRNRVATVLDDTLAAIRGSSDDEPLQIENNPSGAPLPADVLYGVVHLAPPRQAELMAKIREFLHEHAEPALNAEPVEFALVYHRAKKPQ